MTSYGPDEDSGTILLERTFLAGDFINGMTFGAPSSSLAYYLTYLIVSIGIIICMYCSCFQVLWAQRKTRRFSTFLLAYITILFITLLIFCAVSAGTVQQIYIDNRNYPGGPWQYFLATQNLAINVLFLATFFLLTFLADSLIVSASRLRAFLSSCIRKTD
jgi:hypothetical protein